MDLFCIPMKAQPIKQSRPNWAALAPHLGPPESAEFMWMHRQGRLDHDKHIETRKCLRLDGEGRCFVPAEVGRKEVAFEDEWKRVSGRA
jgi:hypothetical protein